MVTLDRAASYRVFQARDRRFDGRVFVGVKTTGVYCRPICPARTPEEKNCTFFPSAAAAQEAGFRPCLRCRPERSPDVATFHGTASTVSRAVALIGEGALDGGEAGVSALADRLGMGERQLRRLFEQHLGASPMAVAQSRRVLFAKQLIQETRLPMTEVALASGYGSVRRFNDAFRKLYGRPPRDLRRLRSTDVAPGGRAPKVTLRLSYRPPYDWASVLAFLGARSIRGVEELSSEVYRRTIRCDGQSGTVAVAHAPLDHALVAVIAFPDIRSLPTIVLGLRRLFDLGADLPTITAHLASDPFLGPLVRARPGLRVPGAWDGFEMAARAVLGQQVTVSAARTLAGRLAEAFGEPFADAEPGSGLVRCFPTPDRLVRADLGRLGLPLARAAALGALAARAAADRTLFQPARSLEEAVRRFADLPGIGPWTAEYIALRALRETDAFPASDLGLLRGASPEGGERVDEATLARWAERWRPWRAYAAQHLWAEDAARQSREGPERTRIHAPSRAPAPRHGRNPARPAPSRL